MVWTGDERVFFYNPSQRASVWERPEDLQGRADVDKLVQAPPDQQGSFMIYCITAFMFNLYLSERVAFSASILLNI